RQEDRNQLEHRKELAARVGGPEKGERHRKPGKLTVSERIAVLIDNDNYTEIGSVAGFTQYDAEGKLASYMASNMIMGRAKVNGRPVVVVGDDFTIRGGANDGAVTEKLLYAEKMAHDLMLPMIRLVDGTGGG